MSNTISDIQTIDFLNAVTIPITIWDRHREVELYNNDSFQKEFPNGVSWEKLCSGSISNQKHTYDIQNREQGGYTVFSLHQKENQDEFVYLASHDLKEPLRKINTFGERLAKSIHEQSDKSELFLDKMLNASQRMSSMLDALLIYSRIKNTETPSPFNLKDGLQKLAKQFDLEAEWVFDQPTEEINIEKDSFLAVVKELLSNASKFSVDNKTVTISILIENNKLIFSLEDNGIGFESEQMEEVIKPFVKLNGRSAFPGNGMGLAIAHKTCVAYGATLQFEILQKGLKAIIKWPLS